MKSGDKFRLRPDGPVYTAGPASDTALGIYFTASGRTCVVPADICIPEARIEPGDLLTFRDRETGPREVLVLHVTGDGVVVTLIDGGATKRYIDPRFFISFRKPDGYGDPIMVKQ